MFAGGGIDAILSEKLVSVCVFTVYKYVGEIESDKPVNVVFSLSVNVF